MTYPVKSTDAPKLLAAAIAMGIDGVTAASAEAAKVAAITKLMDSVQGYTTLEANIFLEKLANKVLLQTVFQRLQFKDPLSKAFFKEGVSVSAAKEVIDNKLLTANTFDKTKRYPDQQNKASVLSTILTTVKTEYITNTVMWAGVKSAFVSDQAFGEWLAKQVDLITESLQIILFETLSPLITKEFKNVIAVPAELKTWDEIFVFINGHSKRMAEIPSVKYNIGFAKPDDAANVGSVRKQITPVASQMILSAPEVINALNGKVSTVKFHNAYFDVAKYKETISLDVTEKEIYLLDFRAFEGYMRVYEWANQQWAANMTIEYFLHYWFVFGVIPWANGVKFTLTDDQLTAANSTIPGQKPA